MVIVNGANNIATPTGSLFYTSIMFIQRGELYG